MLCRNHIQYQEVSGGRVVTVISMSATNCEALVKTGFESSVGSVGGVPDHA